MTRAAIYTRISDDREGLELGVTRQEQDCRDLVERRGWELVEVYSDNDISASTKARKERPDYRRLHHDARAGKFDVVVAYTSGRLTRRPREHEDQIDLALECGTRFDYVRSPSFDLATAQGRRIARTLAAQDAGEAEEIAERVQRQKLQAAQDGDWNGGRRPFGFEADGVTPRDDEVRELLELSRAVLAGRSLRALARELNERGVPTSTGGQWRQDGVHSVLLRARNAGLREHRGRIVGPARWPAVVPEPMWRGVVAKITDPSRRTSFGSARIWLGASLFLCGFCNDGSTVQSSRIRNSGSRGGLRSDYTCKRAKHLTRACAQVDEWVTSVVLARLARPDAMSLLEDRSEVEVTAIQADLVAAQQRLHELTGLFTQGSISARQLGDGSVTLRTQIEELEGRLAQTGRSTALGPLVLAGGVSTEDDERLARVRAVWDGYDINQRRTAIDLLATVTLLPSGKGRPPGWRPGESYFRRETVLIVPKELSD